MSKRPADPALTSFINERSDMIALARKVVGCPDVAEELVQDSWLRWYNSDYPNDRARPILLRIVKNLAIDWYRRQRTEYQGMSTHKLMAQDAPDTERVVIARQQVAQVIAALAQMPERMRKAFRLSRLDGLTYREIGQRLGMSEASAYRLVGEALVQIVLHLDR